MKHWLTLLLASTLLVGFAAWRSLSEESDTVAGVFRPDEADGDSLPKEIEVEARPGGLGGSSSWRNRIPSWKGSSLRQSYTATSSGDFTVIDSTLNSQTGQWEDSACTGSVSYNIAAAASGGLNWFVLIGTDSSSGETVIERWRLTTKNAMPGQPPIKTFKRMQVYRGPLESPPSVIGLDPDRRFCLALVGPQGDRSLYRFALQFNSAPELLYDEPDIGNMYGLTPMQHAGLGRVWMLVDGPSGASNMMLFVDADNDGNFDAPPLIDTRVNFEDNGWLNVSDISLFNES